MKCSKCLLIGHNKATCKTPESEVVENHKKAAEAKKAQSEAAKAHSLRNKQNVRKKSKATEAHSSVDPGQRKRTIEQEISSAEPPSTGAQQPAQPKRRGRPPKAAQVKKINKPSGVGVYVGDDGHTYMSSSTSTVSH